MRAKVRPSEQSFAWSLMLGLPDATVTLDAGPQLINDLANPDGRCLWIFMLPDSDARPASLGKSAIGVTVTGSVGGDLIGPECGVRSCHGVVFGAAMPEATVYAE